MPTCVNLCEPVWMGLGKRTGDVNCSMYLILQVMKALSTSCQWLWSLNADHTSSTFSYATFMFWLSPAFPSLVSNFDSGGSPFKISIN